MTKIVKITLPKTKSGVYALMEGLRLDLAPESNVPQATDEGKRHQYMLKHSTTPTRPRCKVCNHKIRGPNHTSGPHHRKLNLVHRRG